MYNIVDNFIVLIKKLHQQPQLLEEVDAYHYSQSHRIT